MKVAFFTRSIAHFHYHRSTIQTLLSRGHSVTYDYDLDGELQGSSLAPRLVADQFPSRFRFGSLERRRDAWRWPCHYLRELGNYAHYLRAEGQSPYYLERYERVFPRLVRPVIRSTPVKKLLSTRYVRTTMRRLHDRIPAATPLMCRLAQDRPQVVVASPMNMAYCEEVEYVRAARALGIPTVVPILSWDNLTTKGCFHTLPDLMLAWNRTHYREAVEFQGVPGDRILITGAPVFDQWYEPRQPSDRAEFLTTVGLDPSRPYLLYLGSSKNIAADETWLVKALAESLAHASDPEIRNMGILVRPHPANAAVYEKLRVSNVAVWPRGGRLPDTSDELQLFFDSVHHSVAAAGINTTGMIDTIIADKPCIALLLRDYARTQDETIHFRHLRDSGALEAAATVEECVGVVRQIMTGSDRTRPNRHRFVADFIRPHGLDRSASTLAARAIELAGEGLSAVEIARRIEGGAFASPHARDALEIRTSN